MMKKVIFTLIMIVCLTMILFFSGELIIRLLYPRFSNYNMEMWRYAAEIKKPLNNEKLPFHHYPNKEGLYYNVKIKTNSLGFRDKEYNLKKSKDKKRIIFLGDSFTLGWGVPFNDIYSKQLEQMLNAKENTHEVINMGTGNYNSIMELELFKMKGLNLNPDVVILMHFINDAEPTPDKVSAIEYNIRKNSFFLAFLFDRYVKFKTIFDRSFDWKKYYTNLYSKESESLTANTESIKGLIRLCKERNIKILIVNIPDLHQLKDYPFPFVTQYINRIAEDAGIPFLDLLPWLSEYEPESLWVSLEDPHTNAKANTIIAHAIFKKIQKEGLLH